MMVTRTHAEVSLSADTSLGLPKNDKASRRYAAIIEKTLATWEIAPEEWADYIAFLSRLLKAIQSAPGGSTSLPHSGGVASSLAQCLNPGLPSGVHQKALEVYAYIFATFGKDHVSSQLHEYLPGLLPLLSFAALSVRPALYEILEDHIVCLSPAQLRPVLKSFILSLLPALEDETSEDFDRALTTITRLEHTFLRGQQSADDASFYWQSIFLSVITSSARRQGALNYLVRRLPKFVHSDSSRTEHSLSPEAEAAISPEPGLLLRAFACGLTDSQMLIQRGFLDLLTTNLPLHSSLLQNRVEGGDFQLLLSATMGVLLRRDMALNRRIWQWFLGPNSKEDASEQAAADKQLQYIAAYGIERIESSLLTAFARDSHRPSDRVKPFRICVSLMDRWEIGGSIIPRIFLPAIASAYRYSKTASPADMAEFMKSANLFFDGVESRLIWSKLYQLLTTEQNEDDLESTPQMLIWVLRTFNVEEDEMSTIHAPLLALCALDQLDTDLTPSQESAFAQRCATTIVLVDISSSKAFLGQDSENPIPNSMETKQSIEKYYSGSDAKMAAPCSGLLGKTLLQRALSVLQSAMSLASTSIISSTANIYLQILQKVGQTSDTAVEELLWSIETYTSRRSSNNDAFEVLPTIINLMSALAMLPQGSNPKTRDTFVRIVSGLAPVLLHHISPDSPKYNVEATRLLWRMESWLEDECVIQAAIQRMVTDRSHSTRGSSMRTFLNLWNLSVAQQSGLHKSPIPGLARRISNSTAMAEHDKSPNRAHLLNSALMAALDTLGDINDIAFEDVNIWLNSSTHTEAALLLLFEQLRDALDLAQRQVQSYDVKTGARVCRDGSRALLYALRHLDNVLCHAKSTLWAVLASIQVPGTRLDMKHSALTALVEQSLMLLPGEGCRSPELHSLAISVLRRLLGAPAFVQPAVHVPELGAVVAKRLLACVTKGGSQMQSSMLSLAVMALSWQQNSTSRTLPARVATHSRKLSLGMTPLNSVEEDPVKHIVEPQLLVELLRTGFSSSSCFPYLDSWLYLAEEVLPMISSSLSTVLIPLTEVICAQVETVFDRLVVSSSTDALADQYAPDATIAKLLDCLDIFLRGAHDVLLQDEPNSEASQPDGNSTVLSNMTSNMFKSQGPPSKTAKANNRLTAILACKDVVRVSIKLWLWANRSAEGLGTDRHSAATTSYYAIRIRNKARHMLEQMFSLEPLESLEVVVVHWVAAITDHDKVMVISLLHVLRDLRPKNTVPAILDALCSRTNPALLVPARQSTLTSPLSSADLVLFYSAYLTSLEDDALEEVWSDCTAFLRDVLSNPLPHRQILPALIWVIYQLAHKLENTNYGERKRMRRELGDNFQRLLAATFAASPAGNIDRGDTARDDETPFHVGLKDMNLVVILREVIGRADVILETPDRAAVCINTVSTSLVTPALRSKTFPNRIDADVLSLILRIAKKSPSAKIWRKDVLDAFNDIRFTTTSPELVEKCWFPILQQWSLTDKERMSDIVGRLYAPSGAGIMFGVGASAARLDADRKTQLNLRRISLLLLASSADSHVEHLKTTQEKMVELFEASTTSSPSSAVKAELFMLLRALLLSTSAVHFAPLWPIVNDNLQAVLLSLDSNLGQPAQYNNFTMLQACKLLDLLAAMSPDEFQLYEWLYYTNTADAVYHQPDWQPTALSDKIGLSQSEASGDDTEKKALYEAAALAAGHRRTPVLVQGAGYDTEDLKAVAQESFINAALRPFLSQLSINLYESRYRLENVDAQAFRHALVEDLQDPGTIVT
ncbi:hypothetical protein AMS68_006430 [Peltaster fructicola]|uniref:Uncharacterized protein n=1 Tax=Peltaster fructicola TaxID=286661 RepID=A0A6H0Y1N1_9PEZI|nr:hypothetical protein AMS68_006430 [Peltaster fructicola]